MSVDFIPRSKAKQHDWGRKKTTVYTPQIPVGDVRRIRAGRIQEVDPYLVISGGLRGEDLLDVSWCPGDRGPELRGCRIKAVRHGHLLRWASGSFREPSGAFLYAPYLTSMEMAEEFVRLVSTTCGCSFSVKEAPGGCRFVLEEVLGESHRMIPGDRIVLRSMEKKIHVYRSQGTLDMNLYRPVDGYVLSMGVSYITMPHHPLTIVRAMVESVGLLARPLGNEEYEVLR